MKFKWLNILSISSLVFCLPNLSCCSEKTTTFTVTIDLDGGTLDGQSGTITKKVKRGSTYKSLGIPQKDNHVFANWQKNNIVVSQDEIIDSNIAIVAIWKKPGQTTFNVTINPNGGALGNYSSTFTKVVSKNKTYKSLGFPWRLNYEFVGWKKDGKIVARDEIIDSDVEITAIWQQTEPTDCTISIDLDGGHFDGSSDTQVTKYAKSNSTFGSLGEPKKEGWIFKRWEKIDSESNVVPKGQDDLIGGTCSIKAVWYQQDIPTFESITANFYLPKTDGQGHIYIGYHKNDKTLNVVHTPGSQIPYVSIDDLFSTALSNDYEKTISGEKIIIKNNKTSSSTNNVTCVFDAKEQTITFSDYDRFVCYKSTYADDPLAIGCTGGEYYTLNRTDEYTPGNEYTINLNKYNIPIYNNENNTSVYIPYDFCKNIFRCDLTNGLDTMSGSFVFIGNNFYEIYDGNAGISGSDKGAAYWFYNYNASNHLSAKEIEGITSDYIFDTQYKEYTFNLLALTLDTAFGMTARPSRANTDETIQYFPNGAYESIAKYHNNWISTDPNVSNNAMISLRAELCDDGGHAIYMGSDVDTTESWSFTFSTIGNEYYHTMDSSEKMFEARKEAGYDLDQNRDSNVEVLSSDGKDANDIAWVTFDSFISKWPSYGQVTEDNYYSWGTIGMTMYLQKLVNNKDSKIKYVVIDLSNNGGGAVYTEHFLASYLCGRDNKCEPQDEYIKHGGVTSTIYNPHTDAYSKYTYYADLDNDSLYTENDYLPEDVKLYCIVSDASFSCGNMLPCHLESCSKCKFIGSRSGGGCCYVDSDMHIGLGNVLRSSSNFHFLKNCSTINNPVTADVGVYADFYHIPCSIDYAELYYDRQAIISKILNDN